MPRMRASKEGKHAKYVKSELDQLKTLSKQESMKAKRGLHLELLRNDQQRLNKHASDLQKRVETMQRHYAQERSKLQMKQRQMAVQIEMLQEDKAFLLSKYDRLGKKLLNLHTLRIEKMGKGNATEITRK